MNDHYNLTEDLMAQYGQTKGVVGRYSCSKVFSIVEGWITPEQYRDGEVFNFESAYRMWNGTHRHTQVQSLLKGYKMEIKVEKPYRQFVLVGKCDAIDDKKILEIKTSEKLYTEAKRWHKYQAKLYCTLFERDTAEIVQPVVKGNQLLLRVLGTVKRDDKWFEKQMVKLDEFHNKLLALPV